MSKELIQVHELNNAPAYLRQGKLVYKDSGLGAGIAARAPKIAVTTDKRFSLTRDGVSTFLGDKLRVVLVASASTITKAWYAKGYTPGSTDAPDCFSLDAKVPAPGCSQPQSSNCATCKKNAFGSNPVTGRGKACADRKLAVLVWDGEPHTLMTMNFPTMSMQALKGLDTKMREANIPLQAVLVEMSFDPMFTYPVLKLNPVGFVDEGTANRLMEASETQEVAELLREVEYDAGEVEKPSAKEEPLVPTNVVQFGVAQSDTAEPVEVAPNEPAKIRKPRAKKEEAAPAPTPAPEIGPEIEEEEAAPPAQVASTGGIDVMALVNAWKSS